jgi:hypothetical protein
VRLEPQVNLFDLVCRYSEKSVLISELGGQPTLLLESRHFDESLRNKQDAHRSLT